MKSNKELAEEALALAAEIKLDIEVEGLKNAELVELVADLTARKAAAPPPPAPPPVVVSATGFVVAEGKAITCLRGVISEGEPIAPRDLSGATNKPGATSEDIAKAQQERFDELVAKGFVKPAAKG